MEKRTDEQKKEFAKEQVEFLRQQGVKEKERISRIFRSAGPGQVKEAWALATSENWATSVGRLRRNLLDCLLYAVGGAQELGWNEIVELFEMLGYYIPKANSSVAFFKILDGALEILVPGSFELEESSVEGNTTEDNSEEEDS